MDFSNQLIQVLDELGRRFGIIVDWSQQNIMPYATDLVERIVKFEVATSWMWIICSLLITGVFITMMIVGIKNNWEEQGMAFLCVVSAILTIITVILVMCQISDIITATYLPEKIITNMIKSYLPQ